MTRLGDEACPDYATQTLNQSTIKRKSMAPSNIETLPKASLS
ncbi:MAG: hypothetical protein ACOX2I_14050 [Candidatus Ozemobacteraceae bacterium]